MYDVICSICGQQLNFREIQDKEDDTLIVVDPCSVCSQDEDLEARNIYDLKCSICDTQLGFTEMTDNEGHTLIFVDPCPVCSQDEDSDIRGIEEYLDNYGPEE